MEAVRRHDRPPLTCAHYYCYEHHTILLVACSICTVTCNAPFHIYLLLRFYFTMTSIDFSQFSQSNILNYFNIMKAELASRGVDVEVPQYLDSRLSCYLIDVNLKTDMTGTASFPDQHHLLPETLLESFPSAPTSLRSFSPQDNMSMAKHDKVDVEDNDVDDDQDTQSFHDANATSTPDATTDTAMIQNSQPRDDNLFKDTVVEEVLTQSKRTAKEKGKRKANDQLVKTLTAATYMPDLKC
jgi:hypothetical protein